MRFLNNNSKGVEVPSADAGSKKKIRSSTTGSSNASTADSEKSNLQARGALKKSSYGRNQVSCVSSAYNAPSSGHSGKPWVPKGKGKIQHSNQGGNKNYNKNFRKKKASPKKQNKKKQTVNEWDRYVAMDCEMVGTGYDGTQSITARVTLINWDCKVIFDKYVKPTSEVTDYRTFVSGILPENLDENRNVDNVLDIETCRAEVLRIIHNKILIGHALQNDLNALNITHPWYQIRDTAEYEPFMKMRFNDGLLWPRKLKELVQERLGYNIQKAGEPHSPYIDAMAALDLYRCVQYEWENCVTYQMDRITRHQQSKILKSYYSNQRCYHFHEDEQIVENVQ